MPGDNIYFMHYRPRTVPLCLVTISQSKNFISESTEGCTNTLGVTQEPPDTKAVWMARSNSKLTSRRDGDCNQNLTIDYSSLDKNFGVANSKS